MSGGIKILKIKSNGALSQTTAKKARKQNALKVFVAGGEAIDKKIKIQQNRFRGSRGANLFVAGGEDVDKMIISQQAQIQKSLTKQEITKETNFFNKIINKLFK